MRAWQWRLFTCLSTVAVALRANYKPFHNWQCDGCGDESGAAEEIYRQVHRALRDRGAAREVYLLLDHSWIDRLLEPATKVIVKVVQRDRLSTTRLVQQQLHNNPALGDDSYVVVISPPRDTDQTQTHGYPVLRKEEAVQIDHFLTNNPCFMPLHDPPVTLNDTTMQPVGRAESTATSSGTGTGSGTKRTSSRQSQSYDHSAIFVRLPSYPYHATCRLYRAITANQYPDRCPSATHQDALEGHHLGNIGWVNNVYPMISKMQAALHNDRVFITPRAKDNGNENRPDKWLFYSSTKRSQPVDRGIHYPEVGDTAFWKSRVDSRQVRAGTLLSVRGTWGAWADRHECPSPAHFAFDPWSCHFMSLSVCNLDPGMQAVRLREGYAEDPKNGSTYLTALVRVSQPCRPSALRVHSIYHSFYHYPAPHITPLANPHHSTHHSTHYSSSISLHPPHAELHPERAREVRRRGDVKTHVGVLAVPDLHPQT